MSVAWERFLSLQTAAMHLVTVCALLYDHATLTIQFKHLLKTFMFCAYLPKNVPYINLLTYLLTYLFTHLLSQGPVNAVQHTVLPAVKCCSINHRVPWRS